MSFHSKQNFLHQNHIIKISEYKWLIWVIWNPRLWHKISFLSLTNCFIAAKGTPKCIAQTIFPIFNLKKKFGTSPNKFFCREEKSVQEHLTTKKIRRFSFGRKSGIVFRKNTLRRRKEKAKRTMTQFILFWCQKPFFSLKKIFTLFLWSKLVCQKVKVWLSFEKLNFSPFECAFGWVFRGHLRENMPWILLKFIELPLIWYEEGKYAV